MVMRQFYLGLLTCVIVFCAGEAHAGAYTFAGEANGINVVTHAKGYSGSGGNLNVKVCIVPGTPNASSMIVPLSNSVDRFNLLVPTIGNVRQSSDNDIAFSSYDFESVLTHELGHCQGLAHVNLATESGLPSADRNYTKSTDGADNVFNIDDGADNLIGSADDVRGDDVNLHWFFIGANNPFAYPTTPESTTYTRDVSNLPSGDNWVTNADRDVSTDVFGLPKTESVMQQGTFNDEDQRSLAADDVITLQHARVGVDRQAGTADDYTVTLVDGGISSTDCDINISFDDAETGFAVCKSGGSFLSGDVVITTANSFYNTTAVTWHFGTRYIPLPVADNITAANGGSTSSLDGGGSSLLANDTDQQGDGLLLSSGTYFGPESGSVTLNANGTFTYTHDGSATTSDRFVYRVCSDDGAGSESNACAHQYVYVTVAGSGNTPPTAVDDAVDVTRGGTATTLAGGGTSLLANDSDPDTDGLSLTTTPVSGPGNGSVTLFSNGTFSYTHDNSITASDSFEYQVCDDGSPSECSTATVNITVDLGDVVCSAPGVAIPDGDAGGVSDTLTIAETDVLSDLNVTLDISQTYVGDLSATLTHVATGTAVELLNRPGVPASGFGCGNDDVDVVFDDEAAAPAEDACEATPPAIGGTLTPAGVLSDFDGASFAGDWTLLVTDSVTPDPGTLNSWCLDATTNGNAPIALSDGPGGAFVVDEDDSVTLSAAQLKSNDTDAEDGTPAGDVALEGADVNGAVVDNGDQTFTFTHDGTETSSASFQYRVSDSDGLTSNLATVNLGVSTSNDAPTAATDGPGGAFVVDEGDAVTISAAQLTANDNDEEDGTPGGVVSLVGSTTNGSVVDNADQTFTFTHDDSETPTASFQYQVTDSNGASSNTATVNLTVNLANESPTANDDGPGGVFVVDEGDEVVLTAGQLAGNDTDAEDGVPSGVVSIAGSSSNGAVVDNGDQTFTFTHNGSQTSSASFQYQISDSNGSNSNLATVSLSVSTSNDAPVATADGPGGVFVVNEGAGVTINAAQLTANDSDEEDGTPSGAVTVVGSSTNGLATDNGDQTFTFDHDGSETASATFQYQVADSNGASSNIATVTLNVVAQNDTPSAANDGPGGLFTVSEGQGLTLTRSDLTGNDTDAEDGIPSGSLALVGSTTNGTVLDNGNDTYTFTHDGGETVTGSFQYEVDDAAGATSNVATVNLTVTPQKDSPIANDDGPGGAFVVNEGDTVTLSAAELKANDTDEEDTIPAGAVSVVGSATNGAVVDNGDQTFSFTHDGSETSSADFQYQVQDADGLPSNTATVSLQVNGENDNPVANNDGPGGIFTVAENGDVTFSAANLTGNDTDSEDGTPAGVVTLSGGGNNGAVVDNGDQTFTFTHDGTQSVSASFQYQVADSGGATSNAATVNLTVNLVNSSPVANDDGPGGIFVVNEGDVVVLTAAELVANDTDSEDGVPSGTVSVTGSTSNGSVIDNADQTFSFTHDGSESAIATFSYQVEDSQGLVSNTANVTLTVNAVNDTPAATDDGPGGAFVVNEADSVTFTAAQLTANDADAEDGIPAGDVSLGGVTVDGAVVDNGDQTFTFTHDGSQNLLASFQYAVDDSDGLVSNIATVTLSVNPAGGGNAPPVAVDDAIAVQFGASVSELVGGGASILDNDSDPDFDDLLVTLTPVTEPAYGELVLAGDGTFSYTHDGSLAEQDSFEYEVCDNGLPVACATATVFIDVDLGQIECAVPGLAIPDGDTDGVMDTLTVASGAVLSDLDVALEISHTYIGDLTATLTHVQTGTSVPLIERPGRIDSGFGCSNPDVDVMLDDEADDPAEDACNTTPPAMAGTLFPLGTLSDFDGVDYAGDWTITVSDAVSADTGTLESWCLVPTLGGNAPIALDDGPGGVFAVDEGQPVTLTVSDLVGNDSDAEDGVPAGLVALAGASSMGAVIDNGNQTFTFTHDGNESGSDGSFQYQVADSDGFVSNIATVRLTVAPVNDGPVALDDGPGGAFVVDAGSTVTLAASDLTSNDSDAEDGTPAGVVTIAGSVENGSIVNNGDQTFDFSHDGSAATTAYFQYQVADADGVVSNLATVNLTVVPSQDGPTAMDDSVVTDPGVAIIVGVTDNDLPGDNPLDPSSVTISKGASHGEVEVAGDVLTYTPDPGFTGIDEFDYNVADTVASVSNDATAFVLVGELVLPAPCGPAGQRVRAFQNVFLDAGSVFGVGPFAFQATGLPASLTIDESTGVISGVPTPLEVSAVPYSIEVLADDGDITDRFSFELTVDADEDVMMFDSYESSCFAPTP